MVKLVLFAIFIILNCIDSAKPLRSTTITLNNGIEMPTVGMGTWKMTNSQAKRAVIDAVAVGYRHIDTAFRYDNEIGVGIAISDLMIDKMMNRSEVFITTKVGNTFHGRERAVKGIQLSLKNLGLDYLDLALVHWPTGFKAIADCGHEYEKYSNGSGIPADEGIVQTWKGMEDAVRHGLTKSIGVSNFNIDQLTRLLNDSEIKPVVNQVEAHPFFANQELVDFCNANNIKTVAYSPLAQAKSEFLNNSILKEIATKHLKTVAQVMLRWNIQRGVIIIPKTTNKGRLYENLDVFDFMISDEDMVKINGLSTNQRINNIKGIQDHPEFPFVPY